MEVLRDVYGITSFEPPSNLHYLSWNTLHVMMRDDLNPFDTEKTKSWNAVTEMWEPCGPLTGELVKQIDRLADGRGPDPTWRFKNDTFEIKTAIPKRTHVDFRSLSKHLKIADVKRFDAEEVMTVCTHFPRIFVVAHVHTPKNKAEAMATQIGLQKLTILVRRPSAWSPKCIPCIILWLNASGQEISGVLQNDGTVTILKKCAIPTAVPCK